jgi:hypothetical protein
MRSEADSQTKQSQSKPRTRPDGKEETTGILFMDIETTLLLHGMTKSPETSELRVCSPESITHSRETQVLAACPLKPVDMDTPEKVARENMEGT